jgi:hypothetical protein
MYNELDGRERNDYIQWAYIFASRNQLPRLNGMIANFAIQNNDTDVLQRYASAASAVQFLVKQWGPESIGKITGGVKAGATFEQAFEDAIGISLTDFEIQWRKSMGAPKFTATPSQTFTPTATRTATNTRTPTVTRTPSLTRTPSVTRTPTPIRK